MRSVLATILASVAILLGVGAGSPAAPTRDDLTGRWDCDDGGIYYLRQIGNELWWTGKSSARGEKGKRAAFANVFHGRIQGKVITGSWAEDPAGEARSAGRLTLEIVGGGKKKLELKRTRETGEFTGGTWTPYRGKR